jgi:hypothetical protein
MKGYPQTKRKIKEEADREYRRPMLNTVFAADKKPRRDRERDIKIDISANENCGAVLLIPEA